LNAFLVGLAILADRFTVVCQQLDAMIEKISDVESPLLVNGYPSWRVKLSVSCARGAKGI